MASTAERNGSEFTTENIKTFASSLDLHSHDKDRILAVLQDSATAGDWTKEKRISIGCIVASVALGDDILLEAPAIQKAVSENWSQSCWSTPNCVARPRTAAQVSVVVKIINYFQIPFAVRSGGHSPNPGWSSIDSGILIDLSEMSGMSIDEDRKVFTVGPGARWGKVYEFLDGYDVTVIGGRIPHVGVGGLLLGGGISYWTGEFGLAADNVLSFEVVLADGAIINASSQQNSDLFWALKGGGPNFGIVTQFELRTIPVKNIWYELNAYSVDQAPEIFDAFAAYQKLPDDKGALAMIVGLTSVTVGFINSEPVERPASFAPFYSIPPMASLVPSTIGTVQTLNALSGGISNTSAPRHDYRGASSKIDGNLYKDVYEVWKGKATAVHAATGANMTFVLQHIPKNVVDIGEANGGNALGLEPISQQWWTTLVDWVDPKDDEVARSAAIATTEKWAELSAARDLKVPFIYMNDASRDQNPLATYPAGDLERLKAVAAKYDARGIFQTLQNGGFLLSKVG